MPIVQIIRRRMASSGEGEYWFDPEMGHSSSESLAKSSIKWIYWELLSWTLLYRKQAKRRKAAKSAINASCHSEKEEEIKATISKQENADLRTIFVKL